MGGKANPYASANAATDLADQLRDAVAAAVGNNNVEHANALNEVKAMSAEIQELRGMIAITAYLQAVQATIAPHRTRWASAWGL